MKTVVFCYSLKGMKTAERIREFLKETEVGEPECYAPKRIAAGHFNAVPAPVEAFYEACFSENELIVSVGSCGIAVRHFAPFLKSKTTDPAVVAVDELGKYIIPLLSGHIGGANRISRLLSEGLGGEAVITTATDINGRFSVDEWAAEHSMKISDMGLAKEFSAALLERDLPFKTDFEVRGQLPNGLSREADNEIGLYITYRLSTPFTKTLRLVPGCLYLGIGCRRGTEEARIRDAVLRVSKENDIDPAALVGIASISLKEDEKGLLGFAESIGADIEFFKPDELMGLEGDFTSSDFVKGVTGVDNVCERSAVLAAGEGHLVVKKTAVNGITLAFAVKDTEVCFE